MDRQHLVQLKRPDLQTLAKRNNIRATQKNDVIIDELLKISMPNIAGVAALERIVGPMALKKQKVMMRNGLCPKGSPQDRVLRRAPVQKREQRKRQKKSPGDVEKVGAAEVGSASTSRAASSSSDEDAPDAIRGQRSAAKEEEVAGTNEPQVKSAEALTPTTKKANSSSPGVRRNSVAIADAEEHTRDAASSDDDFDEEEEVEAMTSLDNIVVDPGLRPNVFAKHDHVMV
ncbi:hypothetical protein K466DRAFT_564755 [Polyporus arcularius HHB13444]|uniref:Uncharacterized protein n=1 Tax=Polyporus arcularius HHB13444 TaxID=1314778 RepID=A0A5C3PFT3_9APHY|nr:hypothetical protein K466DRAFT_564755 [Polyporus arcularius HHB13444]